MSSPWPAPFLLTLSVLLLTGCSGSSYQPVTGEIVFADGQPVKGLAGGQIVFQQVNDQGATTGVSASGAIDADGKFALSTEKAGDGAAVGEYQIVITPPLPSGDEMLPKVIDEKYTKVGGSTKTYQVKAGPNHFQVSVEPYGK